VLGAGDLAAHRLRQGVDAVRAELEPKLLRDRITTLRRHVTALPDRAHALARARRAEASEAYEELAARGRDLVDRVRGDQRPVEEVLERAEQAMRRDRVARSRGAGQSASATAQARTKTGPIQPRRPAVNTE
jgi:hypothetical protein